jgi:hypothetical protein
VTSAQPPQLPARVHYTGSTHAYPWLQLRHSAKQSCRLLGVVPVGIKGLATEGSDGARAARRLRVHTPQHRRRKQQQTAGDGHYLSRDGPVSAVAPRGTHPPLVWVRKSPTNRCRFVGDFLVNGSSRRWQRCLGRRMQAGSSCVRLDVERRPEGSHTGGARVRERWRRCRCWELSSTPGLVMATSMRWDRGQRGAAGCAPRHLMRDAHSIGIV